MMRDALWFGLYTGMRLREVLRLHWERVDREESVFRVDETKTGAPLELPMTRQLAAIFERRWADSGELPAGWVFPSPARSDIPLSNLGHLYADTRQDGHHPIVFTQCGPVRFRTSAKVQARQRPFGHRAVLRPTSFRMPAGIDDERPPIQHVYAALAADEDRNDMIFGDVLQALEAGRSPILLTERKDHAEHFAERLGRFAHNVLLLRGGMGTRQRREIMQRLEDIPETDERVLIATGRYVGEGFDDARLDTLFLTMPISWKGTLAQYVGRLHRLHAAKREVLVHDYVDGAMPVLRRMSEKHVRGYESLGYTVERPAAGSSPEAARDDLLGCASQPEIVSLGLLR